MHDWLRNSVLWDVWMTVVVSYKNKPIKVQNTSYLVKNRERTIEKRVGDIHEALRRFIIRS